MTGTKKPHKVQRIVAIVLVAAMLAGVIIVDRTRVGLYSGMYEDSLTYAYLSETMECLSYGWVRWLGYVLGTHFSDEQSDSGRYRRACVNVAEEDFSEAAEWLAAMTASQTQRSDEQNAQLYLQLACARSLSGDASGAVEAASGAARFAPEDVRTQDMYYQFSLVAGDSANAAAALANYAQLTADASLYDEIADLYLDAEQYEESGRFYTLSIEANGADQRRYYLRGTCRMLLGQYQDAIEDFSNSDMEGSLYSKGICEMALGDFAQAQRSFETSIERGEQVGDSQQMLAVCKLETGEYAQAQRLLEQYLQDGGNYEQIAYYLGTARAMQEDYEGAIEDFDAAVEAGIFAQESLFAGAQCRYSIGRYQEAAERFEQCVQEGIQTAQSQYYLGLSLVAIGESDRAAEALLEALETDQE